MEYCHLGDLSLFIKKKGQVPGMSHSVVLAGHWGGLEEFLIRYFLAQLASAIEFLRFHQIIHRDLKPQVGIRQFLTKLESFIVTSAN